MVAIVFGRLRWRRPPPAERRRFDNLQPVLRSLACQHWLVPWGEPWTESDDDDDEPTATSGGQSGTVAAEPSVAAFDWAAADQHRQSGCDYWLVTVPFYWTWWFGEVRTLGWCVRLLTDAAFLLTACLQCECEWVATTDQAAAAHCPPLHVGHSQPLWTDQARPTTVPLLSSSAPGPDSAAPGPESAAPGPESPPPRWRRSSAARSRARADNRPYGGPSVSDDDNHTDREDDRSWSPSARSDCCGDGDNDGDNDDDNNGYDYWHHPARDDAALGPRFRYR
jgi:hypothetical protein